MRSTAYFFLGAALFFSSCSSNNVTQDNSLKPFFDSAGVSGCFGLYENGSGNFTIYNLSQFRDSAYLPASTFKIVNSLIGLETGRVSDTSTVFKWNGVAGSRNECNQDLSMQAAFKLSCVSWYQLLARKIGRDTMQAWLDSLGYASRYGRAVLKSSIDTFWLDNSIKITPDEQLGLVKKLYFDQLPFQKRNQLLVRKMMVWEDNANYRLSYKTGWGTRENGQPLGWVVGWLEENKHPYFFVLLLQSEKPDFDLGAVRLGLLKKILGHYGYLQGKK